MKEENKIPKVFISYSWSSALHEKFVIDLAEKLTVDGIEIIIDKWDLKEGQDKYSYMEKMVSDSSVNKVLIISDKIYSEKADNKKGGVGTESQIISSEIYDKVEQTKFIPIVTEYDENGKPYLPIFLRNRIYINFTKDSVSFEDYEKLLRSIYDQPLIVKPALGKPPSYIFTQKQAHLITQHNFTALKEAILHEKIISKSLLMDYFDEFIISFEKFRLPIKDSKNEPDEQLLENLRELKLYRDQLFEVYKLIISSTNDFSYYEIIFSFLERLLNFNFAPRDLGAHQEWWFDNYKYFNHENFLYLISFLIKYKKIDEVLFFTEEKYFSRDSNTKKSFHFVIFDVYIRLLEDYRKQRLKLNRLSPSADLIKERCNLSYLNFDDIMQSDFILSLISLLDNNSDLIYWFPRTLVLKGWYSNEAFPIFLKAESKRYFQVISKLFKVNSKDELVSKFKVAYDKHNLQNWQFDHSSIPFESYMNLKNLYSS